MHFVQSLQAEIEDLLKADAEKEEVLFSRIEETEMLQARLEQQQSQLEELRGSQSKGQVRALEQHFWNVAQTLQMVCDGDSSRR